MIPSEHSISLLTFGILVLFFLGVALAGWGRNLPGKGSWVLWLGLAGLWGAIGFDSGFFFQEPFKIKTWVSGWIWPRNMEQAITAGIWQDPLGVTMIFLGTLLAGFYLMSQNFSLRGERSEKLHGALAVGISGSALAWNAQTPWLLLIGVVVALFGGFLFFSPIWEAESISRVAFRFLMERTIGLLVSVVGACILSHGHPAIEFQAVSQIAAEATQGVGADWIGSALLCFGMVLQFQPFPFHGLSIPFGGQNYPLRILLTQVFPGWASFALLLRMHPNFTAVGLFPIAGWICFGSALLNLLVGAFQSRPDQEVGFLVSAGFCLSCGLLGVSGLTPGTALFIGISIGGVGLALSLLSLTGGPEEKSQEASKSTGIWLKVGLLLSAGLATGGVGFVSSLGGLRYVFQAISQESVGYAGAFLAIYFLYCFLCWKPVWKALKSPARCNVSWITVSTSIAIPFLGLGLFWTGSVSGEALFGVPDRVLPSLMDYFFGSGAVQNARGEDFIFASGLFWGLMVLAILTSFWVTGRREGRRDGTAVGDSRWESFCRVLPRFSGFLARGCDVDRLSAASLGVVSLFGTLTDNLIDVYIWNRFLPGGIGKGVRWVSSQVAILDRWLFASFSGMLRRTVDIPGKIFQLVQVGDLRWYIVYAIGFGFAFLFHYLIVVLKYF